MSPSPIDIAAVAGEALTLAYRQLDMGNMANDESVRKDLQKIIDKYQSVFKS